MLHRLVTALKVLTGHSMVPSSATYRRIVCRVELEATFRPQKANLFMSSVCNVLLVLYYKSCERCSLNMPSAFLEPDFNHQILFDTLFYAHAGI